MGSSPLHDSTVGLVRNLKTGNITPRFNLVFDNYFDHVHAVEDQKHPVWSELIIYKSFKSEYADEYYFPNLSDKWLGGADLEVKTRQEAQRHPNVPVKDEEWNRDPGEK